MTMTSADVRAQQFRVVFRGYDVEEVDGFMDRVQAALAASPPSQETPTAASVTDLADVPARALRVLEAAEQAGEQVVMQARTEAEQILAGTRAEADQLRAASADEGARLRAQARAEAAELTSDARTRSEEILSAARDEAARLELEVAQWHRHEIDELQDRRSVLAEEVERLEAQERTCRERLMRTLQDTIRQVTDSFSADRVPSQASSVR